MSPEPEERAHNKHRQDDQRAGHPSCIGRASVVVAVDGIVRHGLGYDGGGLSRLDTDLALLRDRPAELPRESQVGDEPTDRDRRGKHHDQECEGDRRGCLRGRHERT